MGSRITDQKQVAQLFNEKLVSIGTDTLKQYTNDGLEYVPEVESNIKYQIVSLPVSGIVLLILNLEKRKAIGLD